MRAHSMTTRAAAGPGFGVSAASRAPLISAKAARRQPSASRGHNISPTPVEQSSAGLPGRRPQTLTSFPHGELLASAFQQRVPGQAVVDPEGCARRSTPAFTDGVTTHFESSRPTLRVAAHEAAHVMQHTGASRDAFLGPERHAEAVSHAVIRGNSATQLLGAAGAPVEPAIRHYTEVPIADQKPDEWDAGKALRVSDDGNMAVGQEPSDPNHSFWASSPLVVGASMVLASKNSVIRLKPEGPMLRGKSPQDGTPRFLSRVVPENLSNGTEGDDMKIWADCGRCGRDVMGAGEGTGGGRMGAKYEGVHRPWYTYIPVLGYLFAWIFGGPTKEHKKTSASDPEEMKKEIFNEKLGGSDEEGLNKYNAMSAGERDRFDKETGINKYAAPETGEGYTMSSGGAPVPGNSTWNFHWAGVIMTSGPDRVTLENYSISVPSAKNAKWEFQMYGPANKPGQTFYEQHKASGQHGQTPTAMRVGKSD